MNVLYIQYLCASDFVFPRSSTEFPNPYTTSIKLGKMTGTFSSMDSEAGAAEPVGTRRGLTHIGLKNKKFLNKDKFIKAEPQI